MRKRLIAVPLLALLLIGVVAVARIHAARAEAAAAGLEGELPVGVGAMALASALSIVAYLGFFGPTAQAFSALIALGVAFVTAPLIAWATKGRYYIARKAVAPAFSGVTRCVICERE